MSRHTSINFTWLLIAAIFLFSAPARAAATYNVWNSADKGTGITVTNGGLTVSGSGGVRGVQGISSGKVYFEVLNELSTNDNKRVGIANATASVSTSFGVDSNAYVWRSNGTYYGPAGQTVAPTYTAGDRLMIAFDRDAGKLWFGKNGSWNQGDPATGASPVFTGISGTFFPAWSAQPSNGAAQVTANYGASALTYSAPSGFSAGWYTGSASEAGLFVCATVESGSCTAWVTLADDVSSAAELGITGEAAGLSFGFGFGFVLVFNMVGVFIGNIQRLLEGVLGGKIHE